MTTPDGRVHMVRESDLTTAQFDALGGQSAVDAARAKIEAVPQKPPAPAAERINMAAPPPPRAAGDSSLARRVASDASASEMLGRIADGETGGVLSRAYRVRARG